ncbi:Protein YIPF5 [Schistosoma japonicum]|nr:Protein YIPF5 [Schistosoma japonicum]
MNYEGYTNVYHPNSSQTGYYNPSEIQFSQFSYENANPIPSQPVNLPYPQVPYSGGSIYKGQEEDYENEPPLLEELGINFSHIVQKTSSVLVPFKESSQEVLDDTDLAGPLVFCLLFGCTLMFVSFIRYCKSLMFFKSLYCSCLGIVISYFFTLIHRLGKFISIIFTD